MIFSVSECQAYDRCRRQWKYYKQGLSPIRSKPALELGSMIHQAHAAWLVDDTISLENHFLLAASEFVTKTKKNYFNNTSMEMSEEELQSVYTSIRLGQAMCKNYQEFYKRPLPKEFTLLSPEQEIIAQVPGSEHSLKGRLDALVLGPNNHIYILEHKTYSTKPNPTVLNMNDQFLEYIWLAEQLKIGEVEGILYDGLMKKETGKDLFFRDVLRRNRHEIQEFEVDLRNKLQEMASNPFIRKIVPFLGCFDCVHQSLCRAESRGEDTDYIVKNFYTIRERDI